MSSNAAASERGNAQKGWVFTLHLSAVETKMGGTPTFEEVKQESIEILDDVPCDYGFAGLERAPSTGALHWQGYFSLEKKQRMSWLKKYGRGLIHWEAAKANWDKSFDYCRKDEDKPHFDWWQTGDLPEHKNNGEREKKRWKQARDLAKSGDLDGIDDQIFLSHYGNINKIARDYQQPPQDLPDYNFEWIWGRSGSGKSSLARQENPNPYPKNTNKWWCAFKDGQTALIEDLDPEQAKYMAGFIKVWADKFPFNGEAKGGSRIIRPPKLVITSQYTIEECFNERDAEAIRRRCRVRKMENFQEVPDDSAPNSNPPIGTAPTFVLPTPAQPNMATPTQELPIFVESQEED